MFRRVSPDKLAAFGLFGFALAICIYSQTHTVIDSPIRGDAAQYLRIAINLLQHHTYSSADPASVSIWPDSYRTPGYPAFLAALLWLTGGSIVRTYASVLLLQALMVATTVSLAFSLGRFFLRFGYALGAALLLALWPMSVVQSSYLLTESLFGLLLMLALWLECRAWRTASLVTHATAGLAFGVAALVNPVIVLFPLLLAVVMLVRREMAQALLFLAFALMPTISWQVRNAQLPAAMAGSSEGHRLAENILIGMSPDIKRY